MPSVLLRIESMLGTESQKAEPSVHPQAKSLQDSLSGAFGESVRVKMWMDGTLRALVPVKQLVTSGLVVSESVLGDGAVLSGTADAVKNAERRVAKRAGEGWLAELSAFDVSSRLAVFSLTQAADGRAP